ncbi:hypothetical protein M0811_04358 [Anaeramoeba ignava]|uniref:Uncharacterized protein n=1 Tax=Anaeramoeba ignava TaxID=1746090 RepID=A0A9Q0LUM5_ANAIG|nr:hypothetical protein M0811_04358 [Anaeramoeba ignava]
MIEEISTKIGEIDFVLKNTGKKSESIQKKMVEIGQIFGEIEQQKQENETNSGFFEESKTDFELRIQSIENDILEIQKKLESMNSDLQSFESGLKTGGESSVLLKKIDLEIETAKQKKEELKNILNETLSKLCLQQNQLRKLITVIQEEIEYLKKEEYFFF